MLKKLKPKELTSTKTTQACTSAKRCRMWRHSFGTSCITLAGMLCWALVLLTPTRAWADTAYRCGDAYGPSAQCTNGPAAPVKPTAELRTTGPDKTDAAAHDLHNLRNAQALEQQAAQQALMQPIQAAPVQLNTAKAGNTSLKANNIESTGKPPARKGKHARKAQSPYFTAVDPTATPKKKSTAKAVPSSSSSGQ
jgi:hypothetical protein